MARIPSFGRVLPALAIAIAASLAPAVLAQPKQLSLPGAKLVSYVGKVFEVAPYGAVQSSAIWQKPGWTKNGDKPIPVCWERLADSDAGIRTAIRDAVAGSWGLYGMITFTGWDQCKGNSAGIRIGIGKEDSGTVVLGHHLDGVPNGMVLRVDFTSLPDCASRNTFCVTATAVHEFGHALGLAHEQNRPDAPQWCSTKFKSGHIPDKKITVYDPQSIMNYCNPAWNNAGLMSPLDIVTVTTLYGARA